MAALETKKSRRANAISGMTRGRWNQATYEQVISRDNNIPNAPGAFRIKGIGHTSEEGALYVGLAGTSLKHEILDETKRLIFKNDPARSATMGTGFKMQVGEYVQYKEYPDDMTREQAMLYEVIDGHKQFKKGGSTRNALRKDGFVGWLGIMRTNAEKFKPGGKAHGQQLQEARDKANAKKMDEHGLFDLLMNVLDDKDMYATLEAEINKVDDDDEVGDLGSAFARMRP
jgi:hypothetical protein